MSSLDNMNVNNALSEEYKLTTEPVVLDNATEYEWNEIQSDTLNQPQGTNWRLQLKNISQYCNPAKAYLEIKVRLTDAANTNLAAGINASLQNHILSLFSRATLRVGGQLVESVNECHIAKGLSNRYYIILRTTQVLRELMSCSTKMDQGLQLKKYLLLMMIIDQLITADIATVTTGLMTKILLAGCLYHHCSDFARLTVFL